MQKDCFEVYALVPGLLREEVCPLLAFDCDSSIFPTSPIGKLIRDSFCLLPFHLANLVIKAGWLSGEIYFISVT